MHPIIEVVLSRKHDGEERMLYASRTLNNSERQYKKRAPGNIRFCAELERLFNWNSVHCSYRSSRSEIVSQL